MPINEPIRRIGAKLRQDTAEEIKAPLPARMRELLAKLEQLDQQWRRPPSKNVH